MESEILSSEPLNFTKTLIDWTLQDGNWSVCWRATRDGWAGTTFHARCDGKVPTLTIVKVVKNAKKIIFGGFATKSWAGSGIRTIDNIVVIHIILIRVVVVLLLFA